MTSPDQTGSPTLPLRVLKFGGSSVGTPERLYRVTEIIAMERARGPVAVVVSAMGDSTDWLIEAVDRAAAGELEAAEAVVDRVADLAVANGLSVVQRLDLPDGEGPTITPTVRALLAPLRQLLYGVSLVRERTPQTLDLVLSFGERLSASVLTELLEARGVEGGAVYVDARTWTVTDDRFNDALVDWPATREKLAELRTAWGDRVPVNTGFLARTPDGRTTTLGRNGSDYTATLLARGLEAGEVNIWTDVSGVMTADPRLVDEVYPLTRLSYMEALELATFGTRMFHPRTMIPLIESGIPMRIRNTMAPDAQGTLVDPQGADDMDHPTSVTSLEGLALIDLQWRRVNQKAKLGERALRALERLDMPVWMFNQAAHGQATAAVVPASHAEKARAVLERELASEIERKEIKSIGLRSPVTLLTLVAEAMGRTVNVAGRLFFALGQVGINIRAIAQGASSRSISCVVDAADTALAVRTVHSAFNLAHQEVNLLLVGRGTVGSQLLSQIEAQRGILERDHDVRLKVVGLLDTRGYAFDEDGLDLRALQDGEALPHGWGDQPPPGADLTEDHAILSLLEKLQRLEVPILVDCTAASGMDALYAAAFEHRVHVVAANKKPLTGGGAEYHLLMEGARRLSRAFHYETTCGASLPIIETLKNLVRTGDRVHLIEGAFSGTLGFVANELSRGRPLSEVLREAWERGYTEPDPREDLSGTDMARKALILARELGLKLEMADVAVEPMVPASALPDTPDIDAFFKALERYDPEMAQTLARMKAEGLVLRYLARIEPGADGEPALRVGPVGVPADHPATRLRGAEAFVAFTTDRYREYPLIVQGAGAGGSVTAAGVLSDVLRIAQTLRGR